MELIFAAVDPFSKYAVVGQILKIHRHLPLHQPDKRIPPGKEREYLNKNYVQRMPLSHVGLLVQQNLPGLCFRMLFGMDKYPLEKGEGCHIFRQLTYGNPRYFRYFTMETNAHDREKLPEKPQHKERGNHYEESRKDLFPGKQERTGV